jgi:hypothetical protein
MEKRIGTWLAGLGLLVFIACVSLPEWNAKFKRSQGWKVGDGGYSIALPPVTGQSGGRMLWFYGDTAFWHDGTNGVVQPSTGTGDGGLFTDPNVRLLGGNTIGISAWTEYRSDAVDVDFFAREKVGSADCGTDASLWNTRCPVRRVNLATELPDDFERLQAAGGFIPKDWHPTAAQREAGEPEHKNWLKDAVYVPTAIYPPDYTPPEVFDDRPSSFLVMGFARSTGSQGFSVITGIQSGGPETWTFEGSEETGPDTSGWGLQWGNALLHVPGDDKIRIYGEIRREPDEWFVKDVVLAVAWPPTDIVDPSRWLYFYEGGTGPCPDEACFSWTPPIDATLVAALAHVARDVSGDFSVDFRCYDDPGVEPNAPVNDCAFVLTHGAHAGMMTGGVPETPACPAGQAPAHATNDFTNPRYFAFRTTKDDTAWPPLDIGSYGSAPASGQPDMRQSTVVVDWAPGEGWDQSLLCDSNGIREVRQVRAHDDTSEDAALSFSYYISADCAWGGWDETCTGPDLPGEPTVGENLFPSTLSEAQRTEENRESNMRFGKVLLNNLRPWCKAHDACP